MTSREFFINQAKKSYEIIKFLREELQFAGFGHADIKKTPLGTRITIYAVRPGLVIGSGGDNIKALTKTVEKKFNLENPHLEVEQVDEPFLDAHIVAWRLARGIEKGSHFKRIANISLRRIMQSGARGAEIRMSGKLPSKRSRTWKFVAGNLRKCGQESIDHARVAYEEAIQKSGVVGVKVTIIPPDAQFSDEIIEFEIETTEEEEGKPPKVEKKPEKPEKKVDDEAGKETKAKPKEKTEDAKETKKSDQKAKKEDRKEKAEKQTKDKAKKVKEKAKKKTEKVEKKPKKTKKDGKKK